MGALLSKFWFMLFPAKDYKIVVVGLDNAGKTTTLTSYTWARVWDLGGQERLRTSWATYHRGIHAVITDELFRLLGQEDLQHSVILVFANKQDLKDAMTPAEITDCLSLHSIENHDWHIQACCALTGEGLYDGLSWIAHRVTSKGPS
ncbi:hypothetical protein I3842_01G193700 [Carya illinoinensis]|uniref:Uncharacterized protein n=1 Tax=Carya illinoinensis TaxID=32201 RepID=A0A922G585_CARIL|nr:hypothetical protein I3842_01G193700 [Carya illinoinensis]